MELEKPVCISDARKESRMRALKFTRLSLASLTALVAAPIWASHSNPAYPNADDTANAVGASGNIYATFTPSANPIRHRIDYSIWTEALSNLVVSMGPPLRKRPFERSNPGTTFQTRIRIGHNSLYRLDGSMMAFSLMNDDIRASFTEYRRDLESVASAPAA